MRRTNIIVATSAFAVAACIAAPCRAEPPADVSLEVIRPLGDVYNERASDGGTYPGSLGIRLLIARRGYAVTLQYWRNAYLTESGGMGTLTRYPRLEGGFGIVSPFVAVDSSFEARVEHRVSRRLPLYAGVSAVRTWPNYHYPSLSGAGAGIELRAAPSPGLRPIVSAFYYPSASGSYFTETTPVRKMTPTFGILKVDCGLVLRGTKTALYVVAGYASEVRSGLALSNDVRFIRSDPYLGIGARLYVANPRVRGALRARTRRRACRMTRRKRLR